MDLLPILLCTGLLFKVVYCNSRFSSYLLLFVYHFGKIKQRQGKNSDDMASNGDVQKPCSLPCSLTNMLEKLVENTKWTHRFKIPTLGLEWLLLLVCVCELDFLTRFKMGGTDDMAFTVYMKTVSSWHILSVFLNLSNLVQTGLKGPFGQSNIKSDNLQYDMLARWVDGMNDSATKCLMFQAFFFFHNFF